MLNTHEQAHTLSRRKPCMLDISTQAASPSPPDVREAFASPALCV